MRLPRGTFLAAALLALGTTGRLQARRVRSAPEDLRRQFERRFDVLVVREGLALRPRASVRGLRTIEVSGGEVLLDGAPATGGELRTRLGDDADLVIQLTYLDAAAQRKRSISPPERLLQTPASTGGRARTS